MVNDFQILSGDITGDGEIDILDVVMIVNIVLESINPTNYQLSASDLNQDGLINIQDVILLVNLAMSN